jgi:hypothetical protein
MEHARHPRRNAEPKVGDRRASSSLLNQPGLPPRRSPQSGRNATDFGADAEEFFAPRIAAKQINRIGQDRPQRFCRSSRFL